MPGRIWDLTLARKWHPIDVGRVSVAFIPLSFAVLMLGGASFWAALAFTLLFGISNGLVTIMRGAVPLALFGPKGYGEVLGILATPYLLLAAVAPAAFALVVEHYGYADGRGDPPGRRPVLLPRHGGDGALVPPTVAVTSEPSFHNGVEQCDWRLWPPGCSIGCIRLP